VFGGYSRDVRIRSSLLAAALVLSLVACGDSGSSNDEGADASKARNANRELEISHIQATFAQVALVDAKNKAAIPLGRESTNPPVSDKQAAAVDRGAEDLIRLCRADPTATYGDKADSRGVRTIRQVLEDDVATLQKFQPDAAERLKSVSDSGCG
jgi:hypothetical protein